MWLVHASDILSMRMRTQRKLLRCKSEVRSYMVYSLAVALARTDKRAAELEAAGFQPVLGDLTTLDVLKSAARDGTLSSLQ